MPGNGFELICEVEPPTRPDLKKVRHQIGVMSPIADAFLIPDNHIGRATVSSVAVANDGVHLVPVSRYRQVAARLEVEVRASG